MERSYWNVPKITCLFVAVILVTLTITACGKKSTALSPEIASSDELLFNLGMEAIEKDSEKGRLYLRQVIDSFPKSFYAQRAKLAIADSYFKKSDEGSMIIAASEYREFISLFPLSPSASYAQYQIGMTSYKKVLKPGRDQTKTRQALNEFKKVITNYPLSDEAKQAEDKIRDCEERLAEHTLSIGELYYKRSAYKAATSRLLDILTEYPNYSKMDKVYFVLADAYFKWRKFEESSPYFRKLITDFPQSKYSEEATAKLEEIEEIQSKNQS
ncbi:MAG: outer membrane protein assembly factor BamD [Candidatus Aminicenantes bacterium]|nr:outer membrane protein assembly factor BamD [Candidatus Aminicenantes bacterium]